MVYAEGLISNKLKAMNAEPLTSTGIGANQVYYVLWLNVISTHFQSIKRTQIMISDRLNIHVLLFQSKD